MGSKGPCSEARGWLEVEVSGSLLVIIVNACAPRLGSRAGPRTGKEERGFRKKGEEGQRGERGGGRGEGVAVGVGVHSLCRSHRQGTLTPSDWGGSHRA